MFKYIEVQYFITTILQCASSSGTVSLQLKRKNFKYNADTNGILISSDCLQLHKGVQEQEITRQIG